MEKENKIDIAELLKDALYGIKLWSDYHGKEVKFVWVGRINDKPVIIIEHSIKEGTVRLEYFNRYGQRDDDVPSEPCFLWPSKEHKTWEDFKPSCIPKHKCFTVNQLVLVHYAINGRIAWRLANYSHYDEVHSCHIHNGGISSDGAILPYNGNEDLLGKEVEK